LGRASTGTSPVLITTTWILGPSRTTVRLVSYFSSAAEALTNKATTPANIPAFEVLGQLTTGTPTVLIAPLGATGAGMTLFTQGISRTNPTANRTDNLNLEINFSSEPQPPAGTYTGTLYIQAQAF
jgi:hypothetical protein